MVWPANSKAWSEMFLCSQVSIITIMQLFRWWLVIHSVMSIVLTWEQALVRKRLGMAGLYRAALSLAQTPAHLPCFCLRLQHWLHLLSVHPRVSKHPARWVISSRMESNSLGTHLVQLSLIHRISNLVYLIWLNFPANNFYAANCWEAPGHCHCVCRHFEYSICVHIKYICVHSDYPHVSSDQAPL